MIKAISVNKSDTFDKPRQTSADEARSNEFAALFSIPVAPPRTAAAEKRVEPDRSGDTAGVVCSTDHRATSEKKGDIEPAVRQKDDDQPTKPLIRRETGAPPVKSDANAAPTTANDQDVSITPEQPATAVRGINTDFSLHVFSTLRGITSNDFLAGRQKVLSPPLSQSGQLPSKPGETGGIKTIPGNFGDVKLHKFGIQMTANRRSIVTPGVITRRGGESGPLPEASAFQAASQDKTDGPDHLLSFDAKPDPVGKAAGVPRMPNSPKTELPANLDTTADTVPGDSIVETSSTISNGTSGQESPQSGSGSPKDGQPGIKIQDFSATQILDNFSGLISRSVSPPETIQQIRDLRQAVLDQIEPRIIQLAGRTQAGIDRQIIKMRLHPADLGAVEITLDKGASGKINAHIQTENENARRVLSESISQLRTSLENSGWQVGELEISYNSSTSNGGEQPDKPAQQFGPTEGQNAAASVRDGISREDDDQIRLVNLRA